MRHAVDGHELPRIRPTPRDWLQFVYVVVAFVLVGFIGLYAFALVFNGVTIFGWLFVGGFFAFRHGFIQYRNRLAVSGTPTAKASSAAIGLAELAGRGHADEVSDAPVSRTPCLFWSVNVQRWEKRQKSRGWNKKLDKSFGVETLELEDSSGRVLVWTRGAQLISIKQVWRSEDGDAPEGAVKLAAAAGFAWPERSSSNPIRVTEERIPSDAPLYVIGTLAERREIPDKPTAFLPRLLHRWANSKADWNGQSFPAAFRFASQVGRRWLARDLQPVIPRWSPPHVDLHQVLVWKGTHQRPFIISGLIEREALGALSRQAWLYILGGGALMAGTLLVSIWKLTDVMR
jgi:hypothetical protein